MAKNRNFDPAAGLFGHEQQREENNAQAQAPAAPVPVSTSPIQKPKEGDKKTQVSVYPTNEQKLKWHEQTGFGKKEQFKNDLVMMGLDIVLSLSDDDYAEMKHAAEQRGVTPGELVSEALSEYLKKD